MFQLIPMLINAMMAKKQAAQQASQGSAQAGMAQGSAISSIPGYVNKIPRMGSEGQILPAAGKYADMNQARSTMLPNKFLAEMGQPKYGAMNLFGK